MAKKTTPNAPSTTGKPSGKGRGNNPPRPGKTAPPAPKKK
ncbi:hypothetical protein IMCC3317_34360 [Kordia antarctica]|uniref:Uncharacterized protein n=1 Tax=Kordia antarctica TaxID=1218801 RepID=A0A7L4ZN12_9FLAO|nr:hypothetical protein IMCC3317_34360 [Kordia antarctica]